MSSDGTVRQIFTLVEAQQLLPRIRTMTEEAATAADHLSVNIQQMAEVDPSRVTMTAELEGLVVAWATRAQELGLEVKGLWLVDFDNGEGYYCWKYPEVAILHYHGYDEGFEGRMKIL